MNRTIFIVFILFVLLFPACKKEEGIGGKRTIAGTVYFRNGATGALETANAAAVHIAYGTTAYNSTCDQTVLSDPDGTYHIDGLQKGEYFISAEFTDVHGFKYTTPGYAVIVKNKKGKLTLDINLQ